MQTPSDAAAAVTEHVGGARDWVGDLWHDAARLLAQYGFRFLGALLVMGITVWAETALLKQARDQAIAAVRDALRLEMIGGAVPVTTVRLLDRPVGPPDQGPGREMRA